MNNKKRNAYTAIIFTMIVWGVSLINTKITMEYYNSISTSFWRVVIASIMLFIFKKIMHPNEYMKKEDRKAFLIAGTSGIFLYFIFQNTGLEYISASLTSILLSLIPVLTMLIESSKSTQRLGLIKVVSVLMSVAGVCLIVGFEIGGSMRNTIIGSCLILMSVFSWVIYTFTTKSLYTRYSPIVVMFYQTFIGTLLLGLLLPFNWSNPLQASALINLNLAYLGIICSAVAYLLYNYALDNLNPTVCTIFINLLPAISIITGVVVLKEKITPVQILGTAIILLSIFLITNSSNKESKTKSKKAV